MRHQTTCEDRGGGEATVYNHRRRASSKQCATVDIKILYFVMSGLICTHRQQELRCEDSEDYQEDY